VIVVLQITGGNDYPNTVIPYNNPLYRDNRKAVGIPDNQIMHLDAQSTASRPPAHESEPIWNKCVFWKIRPYWD
jgi:uncharacterized protein (DUF1501 family)